MELNQEDHLKANHSEGDIKTYTKNYCSLLANYQCVSPKPTNQPYGKCLKAKGQQIYFFYVLCFFIEIYNIKIKHLLKKY